MLYKVVLARSSLRFVVMLQALLARAREDSWASTRWEFDVWIGDHAP